MSDRRAAAIGGRPYSAKNPTGLTPERLEVCRKVGRFLAERGYIIDSGNAPGADQAYGRGVNSVDPSLLHLHLPWAGANKGAIVAGNVVHVLEELDEKTLDFYTETARYYRKNGFGGLNQWGIKLMTRNSSILMPPPTLVPVTMVIAHPSSKSWGGGTGQGMRIAEGKGIPLHDISKMDYTQLEALCNLIAGG